jgi:hypothetical protein
MRTVLLLLLLTACTPTPPGPRPAPSGGSRDDGLVTYASTSTIWNPAGADWRVAQSAADRRCRGWGHAGAGSFAGWQGACREYDLYGRCVRSTTTRFYPCSE